MCCRKRIDQVPLDIEYVEVAGALNDIRSMRRQLDEVHAGVGGGRSSSDKSVREGPADQSGRTARREHAGLCDVTHGQTPGSCATYEQ